MFLAQAQAVEDAGYRPLLWDLRGHGASELATGTRFTATDALADLLAVIDELTPERPILVGHSLGGNLSQALVEAHPQRVRGLVIVDSTWNAGPLSVLEKMGLRLAAPLLAMIPSSRLPKLMAQASATTPAAIEQTEKVFSRMPNRLFLDVWRGTTSLVCPNPLSRLVVPLGLIRGADDRTGNIATAMSAWAEATGVREHVISRAGHVVTLDAPEATSEALLQVLETM